jgi:hypothetical protein
MSRRPKWNNRADPTVCQSANCSRPATAYGWCNTHWYRVQKWGDDRPDIPIRPYVRQPTVCRVKGCIRPARSNLVCTLHFQRWRTKGDVFEHVPAQRNNRLLVPREPHVLT